MRNTAWVREDFTDLNVNWCDRDVDVLLGTVCGPMIRDHTIVEFCTEGCEEITVNGISYLLHPGECMVLFSGDVHYHRTLGDTPRNGVFCALTGARVEEWFKAAGISLLNPYVPKEACPAVRSVLERMYDFSAENLPGNDLCLTGEAYIFFGTLMHYCKKRVLPNTHVDTVIRLMEAKYHLPLTISSIADELRLNRVYLERIFHRATGKTLREYLSEIRIQRACTLLSLPGYTIAEIATAVGLAPESFSRVFRSKRHMAPSEYRRHIENRRASGSLR